MWNRTCSRLGVSSGYSNGEGVLIPIEASGRHRVCVSDLWRRLYHPSSLGFSKLLSFYCFPSPAACLVLGFLSHHELVLWPWSTHLPPLGLNFFICKVKERYIIFEVCSSKWVVCYFVLVLLEYLTKKMIELFPKIPFLFFWGIFGL